MEFNIRVILALCVQEPLALCQVNQVTVLIFHDICLFEAGKLIDLFLFSGNPACFVKRQRHEIYRSTILL
ncbi:hypothetical protein D3C87_2099590 [compost metagenome]